jgi:DNA-binding transcriptional regulator YdaS (Cro superfamily)
MKRMTRFEALMKAFRIYRTQDAMAEALGVAQPSISRWINQSKQLPAEHVLKVEADTGVSRHDLRPDIYPREIMVDASVGARFRAIDRQHSPLGEAASPTIGRAAS